MKLITRLEERGVGSSDMRGLTLLQPWATLMAIGAKKIETRSWDTEYSGLVLIHSSKAFTGRYRDLCRRELFRKAIGTHMVPQGCILAVGNLRDVTSTQMVRDQISPEELAFGDYTHGRLAWMFDWVERLKKPIPHKGTLGLWKVPAKLQAQVLEAEIR